VTKRLWGWGFLAALLATAAGCSEPVTVEDLRDNLVVISIDTLRADRLGAYGHDRDTSPTLDALARTGVLFERAYAHSAKTAPSHMSILTGVVPAVHGVDNWSDDAANHRLSAEVPTLASVLQRAGYQTAAFTAGGQMVEELGFASGFDRFRTGGGTEAIFERAGNTIHSLRDSPFFLFVHTYEVHDPYVSPEVFQRRFVDPNYRGTIVSAREQLSSGGGGWRGEHERFWEGVDRASETDRAHLLNLYDAGIRYTDGLVARLVERLREAGIDERTWVVVLSDHGEEFGEHGDYLHETLYQEVLHVPLIVRPPTRPGSGSEAMSRFRGQRVPHAVQMIDVMPTLLGRLDVPIPTSVQGVDLLDAAAPERPQFSEIPSKRMRALRHGNWKLIERGRRSEADRFELYDLAHDPAERVNLRDREPVELDQMRQRLAATAHEATEAGRQVARGVAAELDTDTRAALRALGYLGGGN
jgi:arylsulfatase A-like enzyme